MSEEKMMQEGTVSEEAVSEEVVPKVEKPAEDHGKNREKKPMTEKQKKWFNAVTTAIMVIALAAFLYSGYQLISTWREYKQAEDFYKDLTFPVPPPVILGTEEMTESVTPSEKETESIAPETSIDETENGETQAPSDEQTEAPIHTPTEAPTEAPAPPIDWVAVYNQMKEQNPDYIGWIFVGGTKIYYPVVQAEDNDYYLHRLFDGTPNFSGTIFADYRCDDVFKSGHTILYGHNMYDGSMFANLRYYEGEWFYRIYPKFTVYTEEGELTFEIFSVYVTDPGSDTYITRFGSDESYVQWLKERQEKSHININMELDASTVTLTLSTCVNKNTQRLVVHARRAN